MDLVFFDLDGTLLNKESQITPFTRETLGLMQKKGVAYTVATGRTMLSAQHILDGHDFTLPHIYNNGVTVYNPTDQGLALNNLLAHSELDCIVECAINAGIAPFVNTVTVSGTQQHHDIYHPHTQHEVEKELVEKYFSRTKARLLPLNELPSHANVTNISMIGEAATIYSIWQHLNTIDSLVAYSGPATQGKQYSWIDVHHKLANKGSAVDALKQQLGATNVVCFGDSDNDLSMF
ncbi:MAG: HAD-IIB family hydrolase, partial [Glaciecola sp.]